MPDQESCPIISSHWGSRAYRKHIPNDHRKPAFSVRVTPISQSPNSNEPETGRSKVLRTLDSYIRQTAWMKQFLSQHRSLKTNRSVSET
jgi:hypothetical protein